MPEIDRWILSRLSALVRESAKNYETFQFHKYTATYIISALPKPHPYTWTS